ncbi:MAG TPA: hypothetical protein DCP90_05995 [Clostridiales bacterium]|nr:MAG: hypothetical protein A2Y22_09305 [Clostridiales bacterium GWD2_32_59]HAN10145.1 hypothetical protein [Clostridiales bacterium]
MGINCRGDDRVMKGIILDFDEVIVETKKRAVDLYNEHYKDKEGYKKVKFEDMYCYNWKDVFPLIRDVWELVEREDFYSEINMKEGALEGIKYLCEKTEVIICTIGSYHNHIIKAKFIHDKLPFVKGSMFITNVSKSLLNMEDYIFIDDNANNLDEVNAKVKICLTDKKYDVSEHWTGLEVKNWDELLELIKDYI